MLVLHNVYACFYALKGLGERKPQPVEHLRLEDVTADEARVEDGSEKNSRKEAWSPLASAREGAQPQVLCPLSSNSFFWEFEKDFLPVQISNFHSFFQISLKL